MDDASIIELFHQRDEQAIVEMKQKYGKLCQYVSKNILFQSEDVEECTNTAYFEIWKRIPPERPNDLKTYLCRIVRNISIKRLLYNSAEKRNAKSTIPLEEIADCVPASESFSDGALADAISRFLRTEDELRRKVFVRRYWYGDPLAKIAEYYGLNEKTVATYLFRTRKSLKAYLKKVGYDYE